MIDPSSSTINPFFGWCDRFEVDRSVDSGGIGAAAAVVHDLGDLADQIVELQAVLTGLHERGGGTPARSHPVLEQLEMLHAMLVDRPGMPAGAMPWHRSWQAGEAF